MGRRDPASPPAFSSSLSYLDVAGQKMRRQRDFVNYTNANWSYSFGERCSENPPGLLGLSRFVSHLGELNLKSDMY